MSASTPQDPRILAAIQGSRQATQALLLELLPRVRNLIRYLVRGDGEVDDIAQEALIALARGLPTYRGEGSLKSWADRVVVRVTLACLRKVRKERALAHSGPDLSLVPDPGGRPDEYTVRRELMQHLDKVPYDQRHALVLHHVLGMSVPEIAEQLSVPFETVRSRLRLAQASLRAGLPKDEAAADAQAGTQVMENPKEMGR